MAGASPASRSTKRWGFGVVAVSAEHGHPPRAEMPRAEMLRAEMLGDVRAFRADLELPMGPPRQRAVFAMLALSANRVVARDELVDGVWGPDPPVSVINQVHVLVGGLRRVLEPHRAPRAAGQVLTLVGPGYRLDLPRDGLDVTTFEAHLRRARTWASAGQPADAVEAFDAARRLWRGTPLSGLPGPFAGAERTRLTELAVSAAEARAAATLALGDLVGTTADLRELVAVHPLRERLRELLMTALYRGGDRAAALAVFAQTRALLVTELGLEPGPALQRLHQDILTDHHAGVVDRPHPDHRGTATTPRVVPRQLPPAIRHFAGRAAELKVLAGLVNPLPAAGNTVVISAIGGTAGIGKTALAVHWAHLVANRFPDGQLYLDLRGFDPVAPAMTAAVAVRGFLEAFQVPPEGIPTTLDAQVALYRSLMADKRVLVVLDNVAEAAQVRPLLPGAPTCLVLVTSRYRLSSLVAVEGAHPLTLDLLSVDEAHDQLARRLGMERLSREPEAVEEIIRCCGGLPLALAVIAARAVECPEPPLRVLAGELREAAGRLDALDDGDPTTNVRAVLSLSYDKLSAPAARLFRLMGLHAGPDLTAPAAASLADLPPGAVRPLLGELARAHLTTEQIPGRFGVHDLLRAYALEQAHRRDTATARHQAVQRVLDHYVHTVRAAAALLNPHREAPGLAPAQPGVVPEKLTDHRQALHWCTAERATLAAAVRQAEAAGLDAHTWHLAWSLAIFYQRRGHWQDWVAAAHHAVDAARRCGDRRGQAHAHRDLARAYIPMGQFDEAAAHLRQALQQFDHLDDPAGQGHTLISLGILFERQGRHDEALGHTRQALDRFRLTGNELMQARSLNAIGWLHAQLGQHQDALDSCQRALTALNRLDDPFGQAATWDSLGFIHHQLLDHAQAVTCYERALGLRRHLGDHTGEATVLTHLGNVHRASGATAAARDAWQRALTILDQLGSPGAERLRGNLRLLATEQARHPHSRF